jgi:hypothetical protein
MALNSRTMHSMSHILLGLICLSSVPERSSAGWLNFFSSVGSSCTGREGPSSLSAAFLPVFPHASTMFHKPWISGCPQEISNVGQVVGHWPQGTEFAGAKMRKYRLTVAPHLTQLHASMKGKENRRRRMLRIGNHAQNILSTCHSSNSQ